MAKGEATERSMAKTRKISPADKIPNGMLAHDHDRCVRTVMAEVEKVCVERGLRFTPVRRRTLEILLENHTALGAYELLDRLKTDGSPAQPPTAYRALDFLVENGFAHRIEGLNAYVACMHPEQRHRPVFMVCRACRAVAESCVPLDELSTVASALDEEAEAIGFSIQRMVLEAEGICPECQASEGSAR